MKAIKNIYSASHIALFIVFVALSFLTAAHTTFAETPPAVTTTAKPATDPKPQFVNQEEKVACEKNPAICLSFDPAVNPILKNLGWSYAGKYKGKVTPTDETRGRCVEYGTGLLYSMAGVFQGYGCIKDGKFITYQDSRAVGGLGEASPVVVSESTDSGGKRSIEFKPASGGNGCESIFNIGKCIVNSVGESILKIATLFLGIAGALFNLIVIKTVFQFANILGNSPGMLLAWGILRDIGNMLLLFGFIFIGLSTILGLTNYSFKKALPNLLIFAVLMNFSLFAAQAVIDVSNTLAATMYAQANSNPCSTFVGSGPIEAQKASGQNENTTAQELKKSEECFLNVGLAGSIMQASGLSTLFGDTSGVDANATLGVSIAAYVGLALFATIGAVVFIAAGIMLVIRAIVLSLLMVAAPLGFAALAIPQLRGAGMEWWKRLLKQSFFAPIMILLMLVSLKISESLGSVSGGGLATAITQPNSSVMGVFLVFALVIGFMIASLMAASKLGATGSAFAVKMGGNFGAGGMAFAGRRTIGAGSGMLSGFINKKYGTTKAGKRISNFVGKGASSSFDLRSSKAGATMAKATKLDFGEGQKGGIKAIQDSKEKAEKEEKKELTEARRKKEIQDGLDAALKLDEGIEKNDKIAQILSNMSSKEIEELGEIKKSGANLESLAKNLSPEKFAALIKEGSSLTEGQKSAARDARFKTFNTERDTLNKKINNPSLSVADRKVASNNLKKLVQNYSAKDVQNMPSNVFEDENFIKSLSGSQRDDLIKTNTLPPSIARRLKAEDPIEKIKVLFEAGDFAGASTQVASLKPNQVAKLGEDVLKRPEVMNKLTPAILNALNNSDDLSDTTRIAIANSLRARVATGDASISSYFTTPGGRRWKATV